MMSSNSTTSKPTAPSSTIASAMPRVLRVTVPASAEIGKARLNARITSTMPTIISSTTKIRSIAEAAGFKLKDCGVTLNYEGESSYVPFAEKYKECGAKGIWTSRSASPSELNFVKALDQVGFKLLASGMATCLSDPDKAAKAGFDPDEVEKLFLKLA